MGIKSGRGKRGKARDIRAWNKSVNADWMQTPRIYPRPTAPLESR